MNHYNEYSHMRHSNSNRKNARVRLDLKAYYKCKGVNEEEVHCKIINISALGACFLTKSILYKGDILEISFQLGQDLIFSKARVVRVSGKEIGIKFLELSDEESQLLADYVSVVLFRDKGTEKKGKL